MAKGPANGREAYGLPLPKDGGHRPPLQLLTHLFCFGPGYSASALAARLPSHWQVSATRRDTFDSPPDLATVTHLLVSIPPDADGDPVLARHRAALAAAARHIAWCGYLSTTGVYGDRGGGWVDETSPLAPSTERGARRLAAETAWLGLRRASGLPVHIFRLAGIYGPGRNQLIAVRAGTARRVIKPGQLFSRIHVEDIAGVLLASMAKPRPGAAYNVCDDEPAPPQDAVSFAAALLGLAPPPEIPFTAAELSPMARSFYAESKRVSNALIKQELGYSLRYPTYREGLTALAAQDPALRT